MSLSISNLFILFLFAFFDSNWAKYSRGIIATTSEYMPWVYLDRFCFVTEMGSLNFTIRYPTDIGVQSLLLYYDTPDQWDAVYDTALTCEQRVAVLDPENNQQIKLAPSNDRFDSTVRCYYEEIDANQWTICRGNRFFYSKRSRWWFMAVSKCDPGAISNFSEGFGVYAEYQIQMTNGQPGDLFFYQFSADEFYILPVDVFFLILESIMLLLSFAVAYSLKSRHLLHQTFKLYQFCLLMECTSLLGLSFAYYLYALNGYGMAQLRQLGYFIRGVQNSLFLLLLLLVAKGYTITRGRLSASSICKLITFIFSYMIVYIAMFFYAQKAFDPAKVTYVSESVPGYCLAALRIIGWLSYLISSITTATKYPAKRSFYYVLGVLMTFWFFMGPISLLIANFVLDDWVREEVVNLVECCVTFYGFFVFTILTWPSSANHNFPFHVRTTQIGDSYQGDFPQSTYEVRYSNGNGEANIEQIRELSPGMMRNGMADDMRSTSNTPT